MPSDEVTRNEERGSRSDERGTSEDSSLLVPCSSLLTRPAPTAAATDRIPLAPGAGGRLKRRLIHARILPAVSNEFLLPAGDSAILPACRGRLAMTTDSFVVSPLEFPGGDIGSLAVYGTVNDLAVAGAHPRWISLALIIEEGLELDILRRVPRSVAPTGRPGGGPR